MNSKVCLVGNSFSAKGKKCGDFIDSHEMVVRFNCSGFIENIERFEEDLGVKTTHWAMFGCYVNMLSKVPNFERIDCSHLEEVWVRHSNLPLHCKKDIERYLYNLKSIFFISPRKSSLANFYPSVDQVQKYSIPQKGDSVVATTGMLSILYSLSRWGEDGVINLVGFGGSKEVDFKHYSPIVRKRIIPASWILHDLESERKAINQMVDEGLVRRVDENYNSIS